MTRPVRRSERPAPGGGMVPLVAMGFVYAAMVFTVAGFVLINVVAAVARVIRGIGG